MKGMIYSIGLFFVIFSLEAQRQKVDIDDFTRIELAIPGKLYIKQGEKISLEIECSEETMEKIEFEMRGDRLKIQNKDQSWFSWGSSGLDDVKVYVTMNDIEGIGVSGSGDVFGAGLIETGNVSLDVSGSGYMELSIKAEDLNVSISGSGKLKLDGNGNDMDLDISGSGSVRGVELKVVSLNASISGSGKCEIEVSDKIDANISGSGHVYYKGNPEKIRANSSGSGKVRRY